MQIEYRYPFAKVRIAMMAAATVMPTFVWGQNLANLPGLNEVQQPAAAAVQRVCGQFAPHGYVANPNGTLTERLFYTCREMVQTANALQGTGPNSASLGVSATQLAQAVQAVAPVQMAAKKQVALEGMKNSLLLSRLLDLRSGARGVVAQGGTESGADALTANNALSGASGGGASADPSLNQPYGAFFNVAYNGGNVDRTVRQDAYDFHGLQLLAGVDARLSDAFILGGAISYNDTRASFDQSLGKVDSRTVGLAAYGTYFVDVWYVDGFLSYGSVDYDTVRNIRVPSNSSSSLALPINTSATASPTGDQWTASLGAGRSYDYRAMTISPSARLTYMSVRNKAFTEDEPNNGLGLAVESRTVTSLQSSLGARLSTTVNTAAGVFGPYVAVNWIHEFKNDHPSITAKYVADPFDISTFAIPTEAPDRDYAIVSIGSSATFPNNWAGFAQVITAVGLRDVTNTGIVLGVRKQF